MNWSVFFPITGKVREFKYHDVFHAYLTACSAAGGAVSWLGSHDCMVEMPVRVVSAAV